MTMYSCTNALPRFGCGADYILVIYIHSVIKQIFFPAGTDSLLLIVQEKEIIIIDDNHDDGRSAKRRRTSGGIAHGHAAHEYLSQQPTQPALPWNPEPDLALSQDGEAALSLVPALTKMAAEVSPSGKSILHSKVPSWHTCCSASVDLCDPLCILLL